VPRSRLPGITAAAVLLFVCSGSIAQAESLRFHKVPREVIESRLREYGGGNRERGARLKRMFDDAGCGPHLSEQSVRRSSPPNVVCVLPGTGERVIIVGAHFDRVPQGDGVADNWSGASLLPSLYESVKVEPRQHTFVFIGFTDEEKGLVGSGYYARRMKPDQVAATDAMVNLDVLGLTTTEVWASRADPRLTRALVHVAKALELPLHGLDFDQVGSTDSESFRLRKIPTITLHSLTQQSEDAGILHSRKDKFEVVNLEHHYDSYHMLAVYLVFLDSYLDGSQAAAD
jgi:hypothetical protein